MAEEKATQGLGVEELEQQRKTLFVRNLPFSTSDKELEDVFSEYGPIKRSFVVKDKGNLLFFVFLVRPISFNHQVFPFLLPSYLNGHGLQNDK